LLSNPNVARQTQRASSVLSKRPSQIPADLSITSMDSDLPALCGESATVARCKQACAMARDDSMLNRSMSSSAERCCSNLDCNVETGATHSRSRDIIKQPISPLTNEQTKESQNKRHPDTLTDEKKTRGAKKIALDRLADGATREYACARRRLFVLCCACVVLDQAYASVN
jgi:hypothetical protein